MAIKTILVPLDESAASAEALETAFLVADRFEAHVDVLHVMSRPTDVAPFMFDRLSDKLRQTFETEALEDAREKAASIRTVFNECCERHQVRIAATPAEAPDTPVTAAWHEEFGRVSEVLVRRGRLSDMMAVARPRPSRSRIRRSPAGENLQAVILGSGRPLLLVPPAWRAKPVEHIAIGWNESLEASRALAMMMPCLPIMKRVTVLTSRKRESSAAEVLKYIAWHGKDADIQWLSASGDAVGEQMLDMCTEIGAEVLLVGGFSTTRARQMLFGGVTRHLLRHAEILTVMVH